MLEFPHTCKGSLSELPCLPPAVFFEFSVTNHKWILEKHETFQKSSYRNRFEILGANGPLTLTIPVVGGRGVRSIITDVQLDDRLPWRRTHWLSIVSAYKNAPYFEFLEHELEPIFRTGPDSLYEFNKLLLEWVIKRLKIQMVLEETQDYFETYEAEIFDFRNLIKPSTIGQTKPSKVEYQQVFDEKFGFVPNLSILDYLFNELKW